MRFDYLDRHCDRLHFHDQEKTTIKIKKSRQLRNCARCASPEPVGLYPSTEMKCDCPKNGSTTCRNERKPLRAASVQVSSFQTTTRSGPGVLVDVRVWRRMAMAPERGFGAPPHGQTKSPSGRIVNPRCQKALNSPQHVAVYSITQTPHADACQPCRAPRPSTSEHHASLSLV